MRLLDVWPHQLTAALLVTMSAACTPAMRQQAPTDATDATSAAVPATALSETTVSSSALGGCVRVHQLWKPQLTSTMSGGASPAAAYHIAPGFWAGYAGIRDERAYTRWAADKLKALHADPRHTLPVKLDLTAMLADATQRVAQFSGRPLACTDWYLVYGPGWTDMGGIAGTGMVIDFLGMPRRSPEEHIRALIPHEMIHVAWGAAHGGDAADGTLLGRILSEGFATWFADTYWGDTLSAAEALGYTRDEWEWALAHERELWEAAEPLLQSRERRVADRFAAVRERVLPGGPGKAGYFIGYRIIDAYVRQHGPESWRELFTMPLEQILTRSRYAAELRPAR